MEVEKRFEKLDQVVRALISEGSYASEDDVVASLQAGKPANDRPVKQMIAPFVITKLVNRPEVSVYHETGRSVWVEVDAEGSIAYEPGTGPWTAYQDSGTTPVMDPDVQFFPYPGR